MEAITWAQLGLHNKPCILINTQQAIGTGCSHFLIPLLTRDLLKEENRQLLLVASSAAVCGADGGWPVKHWNHACGRRLYHSAMNASFGWGVLSTPQI